MHQMVLGIHWEANIIYVYILHCFFCVFFFFLFSVKFIIVVVIVILIQASVVIIYELFLFAFFLHF